MAAYMRSQRPNHESDKALLHEYDKMTREFDEIEEQLAERGGVRYCHLEDWQVH